MKGGGIVSDRLKEKSIHSFVWKTAHSLCTLGMTFVIQLVLARMLAPEDFGIVALTTVFMTLANTIIETSFSSSVIQRSELNQTLLSSVFYTNFVLSIAVYLVLFFISPLVAAFYGEEILTSILRIQGIRIVFSGLYSIPQALMNRKMRFKAMFLCGLIGSLGQAVIGFLMAYYGAGVWALVVSTLASSVIAGAAMIVMEPWKPSLRFSLSQVKDALSFSSNILAIRVIRKLFYNVRTLAIGKVYDTQILGFFNKGFQFPSTAMTVVDGSLTSVAFTSLSKLQDDVPRLRSSLRMYVRISMFLCTPLMIGMLLVAEPMVLVLLTEKWMGCVPFLQIICLTQLFLPLNVKTTALEAMGKSKLSMKLHVSGVLISLVLLIATIPFSPLVMVTGGLVSNLILHTAITFVSRKELKYSFGEQFSDAMCGMLPSLAMAAAIFALRLLKMDGLLQLSAEILCGAAVFILVSAITKNKTFIFLWNLIKKTFLRRKYVNQEND